MMDIKFPIRVGIMDDDFFALKWNADLLTRDFRTTVCFETETPTGLLFELKQCTEVDIVLIDVEYFPEEPTLPELMSSIYSIHPPPVIVCLSQYGRDQTLCTAIRCGARGFLLKREIRMEISSALVLALQVNFLITPGILPSISQKRNHLIKQVAKINPWIPHPGLTPQLRQVFTMRVLYGMSAPLTAQEVHLAPGTVEKYMQHAYQKLSAQWGDDEYLAGIELENQPPEVQAFHRFTLPPF
ncbi:MAG: sigma factor-like helix-turn-helix DNA-binding protein [Bacteroidales bacterium]